MTTFSLPVATAQPLRILLVEDSEADAELLMSMLDDELPGAQIHLTQTIAEAVPLLSEAIDIVVTDLSLPDADGLQALTAILQACPEIAVVVMTGHQDQQLALQAISAGAEDYLVKGSHDARDVATAVLYAARRRVAEQEAHRYERLALNLLDAMEAATCAVDQAGTIIAVNKAWHERTRNSAIQSGGVGASYFAVCSEILGGDLAGGAEVSSGLSRVLAGEISRFEGEYPLNAPLEERWTSVRINVLPDAGAVLCHVDISLVKRTQQALSHLTLHDELTSLPNRSLLFDRLAQALALAGRNGCSVAVAFLNVDSFKRINDALGHRAGDQLLSELATRLGTHVREGDTLARLGADEFVVVWPNVTSASEAEQLARRLSESVSYPFVLSAATVTVTLSVGIVVGHSPQDADELLLAADAAMHDAKNRGRGQTRTYTRELRDGVETRLRIETELRLALARHEFELHYQPVIDLRRNVVTGVEALVRWRHPDGLRMPDTFIPVAEATGLIVPLGTWVLEEACRQGAAWEAAGLHLQMAVNFSTRQISHPDVLSRIEDALLSTGLPAGQLLAEVTETTVMQDAELAQVALTKISDLGVDVVIDDFGTGYSSLLYLKRYPIRALKVDRSFVSGLGDNDDDDAIVASVVSLARAVGADCIAEGVETQQQHAALRAMDCAYAQGYLFSRPVPPSDIMDAIHGCQELLATPVVGRRIRPAEPSPAVPDDVVQRIQELHLEGASLRTIAVALNLEGRPNPAGTRWRSKSVAKVVAGLPPTVGPLFRRPGQDFRS